MFDENASIARISKFPSIEHVVEILTGIV